METEDLDVVVDALQHPDLAGVGLLDDDVDLPRPRATLRTRVEGWVEPDGGETWVVEEDGGLVGWARTGWAWDALSPWAGVAVLPERRRRGIGTEAAGLLVDHLFRDTVAHCVQFWVADWNDAGLAFAESLGFAVAGRVRRMGVRDGRYYDAIPFDLLRREWEDRHADRG